MNDKFDLVIKPKTGWLDINFKEIWQYRDLIFMFIKRNFTASYKQTILGPLWFLISPLMTTSVFTLVFGQIAGISTEGVPQFLFYMAGNIAWGYFSSCFTSTAHTFTSNAYLFGKVYFPRLTIPISTVIFNLITFFTQLVLFFVIYTYFKVSGIWDGSVTEWILLTPLMIFQLALLGLGCGIIVSSVTTKYRDLSILVGFGIQLWMYATPVVYPISRVGDRYRNLIMLNPVSPIINNFRYAFLGCGTPEIKMWAVSACVTVIVLLTGIMLFNRVEKNFMDTV